MLGGEGTGWFEMRLEQRTGMMVHSKLHEGLGTLRGGVGGRRGGKAGLQGLEVRRRAAMHTDGWVGAGMGFSATESCRLGDQA